MASPAGAGGKLAHVKVAAVAFKLLAGACQILFLCFQRCPDFLIQVFNRSIRPGKLFLLTGYSPGGLLRVFMGEEEALKMHGRVDGINPAGYRSRNKVHQPHIGIIFLAFKHN